MKDIYIFGAGGFAKEVYFLIAEINKKKPAYTVKGFLDVDSSAGFLLIGKDKTTIFNENLFFKKKISPETCFAVGTGNPEVLKKIKEKYEKKFQFPNLIHPNVCGLFETIKMGKGNIITAGCIFTADIKIGSFNIFNLNSTIGHDTTIENCNILNPGINISGGVCIGNNNLVGTNATILQYIKIGDNNKIGAGAVVISNVENNKTAVGIPARVKNNS